jgi:dTDP-4-amino-4,6-dideoxygalactose transaminase
MTNHEKIFVTKPVQPNVDELSNMIEDILISRVYTNNGKYLQRLENEIVERVGIDKTAVTANGTDALLLALQASVKGKKVLTTPFTFAATTNAICFLGMEPVFCDIDPNTLCLDIEKARQMLNKVDAVLAVQVYGHSGNLEQLHHECKKHGIPLIIDASHSFGCFDDLGKSLFSYGDIATTSFHATKAFSTVEGGAVFVNNEIYFDEICSLRNFGYTSAGDIEYAGVNSKMSEIHAAFGLCTLKKFEDSIVKRKTLFSRYNANLSGSSRIHIVSPINPIHNYTYFPIIFEEGESVLKQVLNILEKNNIFARRYFYPLLSNVKMYDDHWSSKMNKLPNANYISDRVLCLPIYPDLKLHEVDRICDILIHEIDM